MSNRVTSPEASAKARQGFWTIWKAFWFAPRQTLGLHTIRMIFGIILLCWLLPFAGYVDDFFGSDGWFDQTAYNEARQAGSQAEDLIGRHAWSPLYIIGQNTGVLHAFYWGSIVVLVLFTLGCFTRITSVLTWLIVFSYTVNPLISVDTDEFMRLIAFYLMIGYLLIDLLRTDLPLWQRILPPFQHSVWSMLKTHENSVRSSAATVTLRLFQVHFALAVVMMGLQKLQIAEWWGGVTFWYPLHRPTETTLEGINSLRAKSESYLMFISLASYLVIIWQVFFPTFAWRGGLCRWVLLGGALAGTVGLMVIYPIPLMGPVFLLLCLTYLTDFEWFRIFSPLRRLVKG